MLAGKPWAPDGDIDRLQEATERINHSIIGVTASQPARLTDSHNDDEEHHAGL